MASKRKTMKRKVTKRRGGGKRYKRNKITRKRHYGGGTDDTDTYKKILIEQKEKELVEKKNELDELEKSKKNEEESFNTHFSHGLLSDYEKDNYHSRIVRLDNQINTLKENIGKLEKDIEDTRTNYNTKTEDYLDSIPTNVLTYKPPASEKYINKPKNMTPKKGLLSSLYSRITRKKNLNLNQVLPISN